MHRSIALVVVAGIVALAGPALAAPPPKDPSLWMRLTFRGKPPAVRQAIRDAKHSSNRDAALLDAFRSQLQRGQLSVYSAIKLAKATKTIKANETILSEFAAKYRTDLTVKQVRRLATATINYGTHNGMLREYEKANRGRLTESQLKQLKKAFASPSSGSSSSSSSMGMNVGGINIGGLNMGGQNTGGVNIGGNMSVGGVNIGGTSFGGTSVGGINF